MPPNKIPQMAEFLGLSKPYDIRIKSKAHRWAAGFCEQHTRKGVIVRHVITLYLPQIIVSEFRLDSIIAHEFIHAWQAENGVLEEGKYHNKKFRKLAKEMGEYFNIPNIWSETDTN